MATVTRPKAGIAAVAAILALALALALISVAVAHQRSLEAPLSSYPLVIRHQLRVQFGDGFDENAAKHGGGGLLRDVIDRIVIRRALVSGSSLLTPSHSRHAFKRL